MQKPRLCILWSLVRVSRFVSQRHWCVFGNWFSNLCRLQLFHTTGCSIAQLPACINHKCCASGRRERVKKCKAYTTKKIQFFRNFSLVGFLKLHCSPKKRYHTEHFKHLLPPSLCLLNSANCFVCSHKVLSIYRLNIEKYKLIYSFTNCQFYIWRFSLNKGPKTSGQCFYFSKKMCFLRHDTTQNSNTTLFIRFHRYSYRKIPRQRYKALIQTKEYKQGIKTKYQENEKRITTLIRIMLGLIWNISWHQGWNRDNIQYSLFSFTLWFCTCNQSLNLEVSLVV